MTMTLGADVEFFAQDRNGIFRSVVGKIGGTKHEPIRIENYPGVISEDNVAIEYAIDKASNREQFIAFNWGMYNCVSSELDRLGFTVSREAFGNFPDQELFSPESRQAGCDPDFGAWNEGKMNIAPDLNETNFRSAGGHLHFGVKLKPSEVLQFVKVCDLVFGLTMLPYESAERKKLYGKAGCFRRKPYGIEYRTLSNAWINDLKLVTWGMEMLENIWKTRRDVEVSPLVEQAINTHDRDLARELIIRYGIG